MCCLAADRRPVMSKERCRKGPSIRISARHHPRRYRDCVAGAADEAQERIASERFQRRPCAGGRGRLPLWLLHSFSCRPGPRGDALATTRNHHSPSVHSADERYSRTSRLCDALVPHAKQRKNLHGEFTGRSRPLRDNPCFAERVGCARKGFAHH